MSISKGGQKQATSQETNVSPETLAYLKQIMAAAQASGGAGPSPLTTAAAGYNTNAMNAGNFGMGALSGDPAALGKLMDPYQQQVIDANNRQWGVTNQNTMNAVDDAATRAGAFGGSRHGVATGTALAANNLSQQGQTAGLLSGGFSDAMGRAAGLAGMGFNAAGANANLGMGGVGSPQAWLLEQLRKGFVMPTGQSSTGSASTFGGQAGFSLPFFGGK